MYQPIAGRNRSLLPRLVCLGLWVAAAFPLDGTRAPAHAQSGFFGANRRVNTGGEGSGQAEPRVAVGPEGTVYALWLDWRVPTGGVFLARSSDGGMSFDPESRVDPEALPGGGVPFLSAWPRVAADGPGSVYVAWVSWVAGETGRVWCARSRDAGGTFDPPVLVSDSEINDRAWPAIAGDPQGGVYLVWCDFRDGEDVVNLYASHSADGTLFSPNVRANLSAVGPTCTPPLPQIAAGDLPGHVHIVWRQTFGTERWIYACRSLDGAATFRPAVEVSHEPWDYGG